MKKNMALIGVLGCLAHPAWAANINTLQNLGQAEFKLFSEDLGAALSYKSATPAEPLGVTGFELERWGHFDRRLFTRTTVSFQPSLPFDQLIINGHEVTGVGLDRGSNILDIIRGMANLRDRAEVMTENNFPSGAGIDSSASAFATLALAGSKPAGLNLSEPELSRLARRGSGSASRSIPSGFVEWQAGTTDEDSYAFSIAEPGHWKLADCIAVVSASHKKTGSTEGHAIALTSPLQAARVADTPRRLDMCRKAILDKDFNSFASIVELDSDIMHAVMMTSTPALHYWKPASLAVMNAVRQWRVDGLPACYTVDAGPNVHVICPEIEARTVDKKLREIKGVTDVLIARAGGAAQIVNNGD